MQSYSLQSIKTENWVTCKTTAVLLRSPLQLFLVKQVL